MESITLKKNSWHYWLVKHLTQWERLEDQNDFCKYCRYVFGSAFMFAIVIGAATLLAGVVLSAITNILYLLYSVVVTGHFHALNLWGLHDLFAAMSIITAILVGVFAFVAGIFWLQMKYTEYKENKPESNSFISNAYRSIKNKICFKVTFQNKE